MNMTVFKDFSYGTHERQKADIYIPEKPVSQSGLILFIHGGGWTEGDKSDHTPDAEFFSELGYICAAINYRYVSKSINIRHVLDDVTSSLNTIKQKCSEYGYNINELILSGGSAGSHIALLYAYTKKEVSPIKPSAVCCYCPPTDCTREDFLMGIKGEFESWKYGLLSQVCNADISKETLNNEASQKALSEISPINYVDENCIPTAIFYGKKDDLIPAKHIEDFECKLARAGIKHDFVLYKNSGHLLDKDPDAAIKARKIIKQYAELYF